MALDKKTNALFKLMELFLSQKEISSKDEHILDILGCSPKTLERYLKDIESLYPHIMRIKQSRKYLWKLVRVSDILEEFIKNSEDISQLFIMAQEFDPQILKELEKGTLSKISKESNVFLFRNSIMETIQDQKSKEIFKNLKRAIANHEYRDITYTYNKTTIHRNTKCIKLVFLGNNWYVALVDEEKKLLFRRLSFIDKVSYSSKNCFQRYEIAPYLEFLKTAQNPMSLYGEPVKKATIKANPNIAIYFQKGMKKFLPSQTFKKRLDDGSIIFTLNYTQELEILPLIQKWLPDLIILKPQELKDAYIKKLNDTLDNHG